MVLIGVLSLFLQGTVVSLKRYVVSKGIFQSATTRAIVALENMF